MNGLLIILTICFFSHIHEPMIHKSGFIKVIIFDSKKSDQEEYEAFYLEKDVYIFQDELYEQMLSCKNEVSCQQS